MKKFLPTWLGGESPSSTWLYPKGDVLEVPSGLEHLPTPKGKFTLVSLKPVKWFSIYQVVSCKIPFPASDLITILRTINQLKEGGPYDNLWISLKDPDPRTRRIKLKRAASEKVPSEKLVLTKKLYRALVKLLGEEDEYDLPSIMLEKLYDFQPETRDQEFTEEVPGEFQTPLSSFRHLADQIYAYPSISDPGYRTPSIYAYPSISDPGYRTPPEPSDRSSSKYMSPGSSESEGEESEEEYTEEEEEEEAPKTKSLKELREEAEKMGIDIAGKSKVELEQLLKGGPVTKPNKTLITKIITGKAAPIVSETKSRKKVKESIRVRTSLWFSEKQKLTLFDLRGTSKPPLDLKPLESSSSSHLFRLDQSGKFLSLPYKKYVNAENTTKASPYLVGLSGKVTAEALEYCNVLASRLANDPIVKEVKVMAEKTHYQNPSFYPRLIISPSGDAPLGAFIESLHLLLMEEQFEKILDPETCVHQALGWSSMGVIRNFTKGTHIDETPDMCVFSLAINSDAAEDDEWRRWGPNETFLWEAHPFARSWKTKKDRPHHFELLVARWDSSGDRWIADYGFFETGGEKIILHPHALSVIMGGEELPLDRTRLDRVIYQDDVDEWGVKTTTKYSDYLNCLARYGFLEDGTIDLEYV